MKYLNKLSSCGAALNKTMLEMVINLVFDYRKSTGCPRMFYTVFQKNTKNMKSTMSLIIILVIECLICVLPTVKISFTYLYPLRCDMVSLKIDE